MNAPLRMPPIPAPPHDPRSWLLAGWIGSDPKNGFHARVLDKIEILPALRALTLAPAPDVTRLMSEPSGSFGGLRTPFNVAISAAGDIYVLDPVDGALKRFDACECRFDRVPCFTRVIEETLMPCAVVEETAPAHSLPREQGRVRVEEAMLRRVPLNLLRAPHGIAICNGDLFVADSGHARVVRYTMNGFVPRGAMQLPRAEQASRAKRWYPFAAAIDGHGSVYVSDPANQRIDRFDAYGRWKQAFTTDTPAWSLAVDCDDRLHAVLAQVEGVELVTGQGSRWAWKEIAHVPAAARVVRIVDGQTLAIDDRAAHARNFPPPPLAIDARGYLHLPCVSDEEKTFDARGIALGAETPVVIERYQRSGKFESIALDARIDACQWHRVELRGSLPKGCRITVRTLTAHVALDENELAALPDTAWSSPCTATSMADGRWDCLVLSAPGRFLWLRLEFSGDGHATPSIESVVVEFPRISLRRYLPAVFGAEPLSADFTDRFTAVFDTTLRSIERRVDRLAELFDPLSAPTPKENERSPDFLSWIASWIGLTLARGWSETRRRRFIKEAAKLYCRRGTPGGLRQQLWLLLGFDRRYADCPAERPSKRCVPLPTNCGPEAALTPAALPPLILEHFKLRRWLFAGRGRLGDDSVLWGKRIVNRSQLSGTDLSEDRSGNAQVGESRLITTPDPQRDPFHVYAHRFSVFVPARIRDCDAERRALEQLLERETPAHTQRDIHYVEPRFRVGVQAMIGFDSVIARTPSGVALNDNALGQGTVLSAPAHRANGPTLRVGESRVGTTTTLT